MLLPPHLWKQIFDSIMLLPPICGSKILIPSCHCPAHALQVALLIQGHPKENKASIEHGAVSSGRRGPGFGFFSSWKKEKTKKKAS